MPLTIEHYGIHASIKENGRIIISNEASVGAEGDYDEIEIPASLVFKLARLLHDTRTLKDTE